LATHSGSTRGGGRLYLHIASTNYRLMGWEEKRNNHYYNDGLKIKIENRDSCVRRCIINQLFISNFYTMFPIALFLANTEEERRQEWKRERKKEMFYLKNLHLSRSLSRLCVAVTFFLCLQHYNFILYIYFDCNEYNNVWIRVARPTKCAFNTFCSPNTHVKEVRLWFCGPMFVRSIKPLDWPLWPTSFHSPSPINSIVLKFEQNGLPVCSSLFSNPFKIKSNQIYS
jgi:hypothetical protein